MINRFTNTNGFQNFLQNHNTNTEITMEAYYNTVETLLKYNFKKVLLKVTNLSRPEPCLNRTFWLVPTCPV